jgi:replicative DNA helicase
MEETGASALRSIPRALWATITLLGIGQICAWGTLYYSFAVTGPLIAREFGIALPSAVLGYSALLVAGAFAAPTVGRTIDRLGGRAVLAGGAVVGALGLTMIGLAPGPLVYAIGCLILGIAVAMSLYDAAFPALVQVAGPNSNRAITLLTLFGGLASTFFWPIAAAIAARWGWRATYLSFAAVNICVCLPISLIALPRRPPLHVATDGALGSGWSRPPLPLSPEARRAAFICFALMVAAGNFVFAGLAVHLLTILGALGLSESAAIIIGMIVGPAQVIGRIGEMSLGPRARPILAGRISAAMQPASIAVLIFAPVGIATGGIFAALYGMANGILTIVKGTVSLFLFGSAGYGEILGKLSVPSLGARAAAPLVYAYVFTAAGPIPTLILSAVVSLSGTVAMELACQNASPGARGANHFRSPRPMANVEAFGGRRNLAVAAPQGETNYRIPPHNIEAEQALLGAILVNNDAFDRVSDFLQPEHFSEALHQRIYEIASQLIRAGKVATPVTLKTFLTEQDVGQGVTVSQYLARLAAEATTIINAEDYGRTVHDLSVRRDLIVIGEEIVNSAFDAPVDSSPRSQIEEAERKLYSVAETGQYDGGFQRFSEALTTAIDMAAHAYERDGGLSGTATGLTDLDHKMGGLQRSDLVIIAGRPGMGKTALATNIAFNIARSYEGEALPDGTHRTKNGGIVGFFSLEMSSEQLATRIIAEQSGVASYKIRRGDINESDFYRITEAAREMQTIPFYIDQTGGLSIAQLTARARRLKRQRGLDVLVVDYIQLLSGSRSRSENRVQELTEITTGLKALAKELNVPILALSQLSRQVESRDDKRPQLSDLRESGSIEQDADVVLFVFREEYYLANKKPREGTEEFLNWEREMERAHGRAEVIIGKQRHGPTGTVDLSFEAEVTRFGNLAREENLPARM